MKKLLTICLLFYSITTINAQEVLDSDLTLKTFLGTNNQAVRIGIDKSTKRMFYTTVDGKVYEVLGWQTATATGVLISSSANHGIQTQMGGMCVNNNVMYVCGNNDSENNTTLTEGLIMKGDLSQSPVVWSVVAKTDLYQLSNTAFDHRMNSVELDPSGQWLFVNSGSKSDHGEAHNGSREVPITARILKIPSNSSNLQLINDSASIAPYTFSKGTRNSFGLAFDYYGNLFGTENSGDRDQPDELNWLREGLHYGFPWDMGGMVNPQQFNDYNPGTGTPKDKLIPPGSTAWFNGYFYNDPSFPQKPKNLALTSPVLNDGPHANKYRDSITGKVMTKLLGKSLATFSPHLSPSGIIFDNEFKLGGDFTGGCFVANYNQSGLAYEFTTDKSNGAIMYLKLNYDEKIDNYRTQTNVLVSGLGAITDLEIFDNSIYAITNDNNLIYKLDFPVVEIDDNTAKEALARPIIDGKGNEISWKNAIWRPINNLFVDNVSQNQNTMPSASDLSGRYKAIWKGNEIFVLAEITDDSLFYIKNPASNSPTSVFNGDALEILVDENNSGGAHTKTHNAFAYHISPQGYIADQCGCGSANDYAGNSGDWNARYFNDVGETKVVKNGNVYTWEVAIKVYNDTYVDQGNNQDKLVNLFQNKVLGFGVAYNDYDASGNRETLLGSFSIPGNNNGDHFVPGGRNIGWQDASSFGTLILDGKPCILPLVTIDGYSVNTNVDNGAKVITPIIDYEGNDAEFRLLNSDGIDAQINTATGVINIHSVTGHGTFSPTLQVKIDCSTVNYNFSINSCGTPVFDFDSTVVCYSVTTTPFVSFVSEKYSNPNINYSIRPQRLTYANIKIAANTGEITITPIKGKAGKTVVTITGTNSCIGGGVFIQKFNLEVLADSVTSTQNITNTSIVMHPNPALDKIFFSSEISLIDSFLQISDLSGKTLLAGKYNSQGGFDITSLPRGSYVVKIELNNRISNFKLIKI